GLVPRLALDVGLWMERELDEGEAWHKAKGPTPLKGCAVPDASFSIYEGMSNRHSADGYVPQPVCAFVARYRLGDKLEVAVVGLGPAGKKWRTWESAYEALAKSLQPVVVASAAPAAAGGSANASKDPRAAKRAKLQ